MIEGIAWLSVLAVFSGLSMNVILQFGLGLRGIALDTSSGHKEIAAGSGIFFLTVLLLWFLFFFTRPVLFLGFLEYILLFPMSALVFSGLEYLLNRFVLLELPVVFNDIYAAGTAGTALFITLHIANNVPEAVVLSLGFTVGMALAVVIVAEIRRRSEMEAVPRWLQGGPLALIAMGLLSLVFSSGAVMLFEVLGAR